MGTTDQKPATAFELAHGNGDSAARVLFDGATPTEAAHRARAVITDAAALTDDETAARYVRYYAVAFVQSIDGERWLVEALNGLWKDLSVEREMGEAVSVLALCETKKTILDIAADRMRTTHFDYEANLLFEFLCLRAAELCRWPVGDQLMAAAFRRGFDHGCSLRKIVEFLRTLERISFRATPGKKCDPRPLLIHAWARNGGADEGYSRGIQVSALLQSFPAERWEAIRSYIQREFDQYNREQRDLRA